MDTFLVTGGAGFIGSHLCDRLLAEGNRVVAIDDMSTGSLANLRDARGYGPRFTFYRMDVRAQGIGALVERHHPNVLVHLAALPGPRAGADPAASASVGVLGLLGLLEAAVVSGTRKVVLASSASVYGDARQVPLKETAHSGARPVTPTAIAKKVAAEYLRFFERSRGLQQTVVILPAVYGPRQDSQAATGVVARFAGAMLAQQRPVVLGDGNQTRDFLFVSDAVHALALSCQEGSGRTVNVGTGLETSVNGLFRMLADITGFRGEPAFGPLPWGEVRRSALDAGLANRVLGWRPWTHLEDGLRETVAWLRDQRG
jgi:UDP-glucose 4-epimerase